MSLGSYLNKGQSPYSHLNMPLMSVFLCALTRGPILRDYPTDGRAPSVPRQLLRVANAPVCSMQYSGKTPVRLSVIE